MQGGGVRCLWQAGFLSAVAPHWEAPRHICAVSAAAAIACAFAAGRLDAGVEAFKAAVANNRKNFYASHVFSRKPLFPHAAMYRTVLAAMLNDAGMEALQGGPDVDVLLCRPPRRLPSVTVRALLLGIGVSRQFQSSRLSAALVRVGQLSPEFVPVRSCRDSSDVADLVLASSSTPPITPLFSYRGRHALDGGVLESVPVSGLRHVRSRALVMLTSHHGGPPPPALVPPHPAITVVAPSRQIPGAPWDYANPELLEAFLALGREDGRRFAESAS